MKSLKYILVPALTGLLFTACSNEPTGPSQAELDAQVETKVNARRLELDNECNTRLLDAANAKKDSVMANMKSRGKKVTTVAPKPAAPAIAKTPVKATPKPPVKEKPKTVEAGGLRGQSDQAKLKDKTSVEGGGLRGQSDQNKAKTKSSVEGGGLRGQSDQAKEGK